MYKTDGKLFRLSRLKAKSKVTTTSVIELQYADDNVVSAQSEEELQAILGTFTNAYDSLGLTVNIKKTKVVHQPSPLEHTQAPCLKINNVMLENVDHFPYLGSHLSNQADIDAEIQHRLSCASSSFARLRRRVFDDKDIRSDTKLLVYKAVVLPTLLYGSETWTTYRRHIKSLEKYHQRCLRKLLRITWEDKRTNASILEEAGATTAESIIIHNQLRWTGHVVRMPDHRLPKQLLFSQLMEGSRKHGGQHKRFKDTLKSNLRKFAINTDCWETLAKDRSRWRSLLNQGHHVFEASLKEAAEDKRKKRKDKDKMASSSVILQSGNKCSHCGRVCGSRIGLYSHMRTHKLTC